VFFQRASSDPLSVSMPRHFLRGERKMTTVRNLPANCMLAAVMLVFAITAYHITPDSHGSPGTLRTVSAHRARTLDGADCLYASANPAEEWCGNSPDSDCNGNECGSVNVNYTYGDTLYPTQATICGNYSCCDSYPSATSRCTGG